MSRFNWLMGVALSAAMVTGAVADDTARETARGAADDEAAKAGPSLREKADAAEKARDDEPESGPESGPKAGAVESAPAARRVARRPAPKSLAEAMRRLDRIRVDVEFDDLKIEDAVSFIGRLAGFNVILGAELQKEGLEGVPRVSFKLRKASLKQVAELVARFTRTKMKLESGILSFTTPEAARGKPVLRIYSIADITTEIMNFPGPDLNLRPSDAEFEEEEPSKVENAFEDPDTVTDMIERFVESETWQDEDVSIYADSKRLVIRQYPEVHRKIARFLNMLRSSR